MKPNENKKEHLPQTSVQGDNCRKEKDMNNLIITEYHKERILSTAQLAEAYETSSDVITKNFNRNIDRYQEEKHYFVLEGEALKAFKSTTGQIDLSSKINKLYLWTEKGCLHHAKSLGTDKAWEVFEMLEETYFRLAAPKQMTQAEILAGLAQCNVELERKVTAIDTRLTNALDVFTAPSKDDWRHEINADINFMIETNGLSHLQFRHELYQELEQTCRVDLTSRQTRLKARMKLAGATYAERQAISKLDVVERDPMLKAVFESIVRKYQAKYAR